VMRSSTTSAIVGGHRAVRLRQEPPRKKRCSADRPARTQARGDNIQDRWAAFEDDDAL
jgi:hypothetical protein